MPGKITVYLDLVSPFAYIGYHILRHSPAFKDVTITAVPIFLGRLMKSTGNISPIFNKDKYLLTKDRLRWSRIFSVPMCIPMPTGFPVNLVKPNRALAYIASRHPTHLPTAFEALYHQFWGLEISNVNIGQPDGEAGFLTVLREVLPREVYEDVEREWSGEEAKTLLVQNTERAEREGVFGCPWFDCENEKGEREGFWGVDHMGQVVRFMGLEDRDENQQVLKALL
ncbi:uncharacterized protein AB675_655 [Cyphellophora attinorum]|uniref:Glutathione S-transferase kappa n=1 Tax=Cyphellophora attinorum TaxID=1664694 RepID=A0A0N0NRY0_9EURO|nr:uncharacterized protein AB675_655 [Phialophora attinorum]KPI45611.1 hypothetical protein AB675_655 [Phialophora attinorum]